MKRTTLKIIIGIILYMILLYGNSVIRMEAKAEVKPEYMQDVPLDETHFPDEYFRTELERWLDENKDGILSRQERETVHYLRLNSAGSVISNCWYSDMRDTCGEDNLVYHSSKSRRTFKLGEKTYANQTCKILYEGAEKWSDKINLMGIEYFFNLQEVRVDRYELLSGSF